jgi:hypothetical protein
VLVYPSEILRGMKDEMKMNKTRTRHFCIVEGGLGYSARPGVPVTLSITERKTDVERFTRGQTTQTTQHTDFEVECRERLHF